MSIGTMLWFGSIAAAALFGWDGEKRAYARFLEFVHMRGVRNRVEGLFLSDSEFLAFATVKIKGDGEKTRKKGRFFA